MHRFLSHLFVFGLFALAFLIVAWVLAPWFWLFELSTHFWMYTVLGTVVLAVLAFALRRRRWAVLLGLFMLLELVPLGPYLSVSRVSAEGIPDLVVVSANVGFLNVRRNVTAADALIETEDPDVFVLQELTPTFVDHIVATYSAEYPYIFTTPSRGGWGILIASKYPMTFETIRFFDNWMPHGVVTVGDRLFHLIGVHPFSPISREFAEGRNRDFIHLARTLAELDEPVLVMGDFNAAPWSPHFKRLVQESGLNEARLGFGMVSTWNDRLPLVELPIDHVLYSGDDFEVMDFRVGSVSTGSDHRPLVTSFRFK